jgi:hypothetical protein
MRSPDDIRVALLAVIALVVAGCGGRSSHTPPPPMNSAPAVSQITDKAVDQDTSIEVEFGVDDRESGAAALAISAGAEGSSLFPEDGVVLSGSGTARKLVLTPFEAATGVATVAIRVVDPQGMATTRSFRATVNEKPNSIRAMALETFSKSETDMATVLNGWTIRQDADDATTFAALIPAEEP